MWLQLRTCQIILLISCSTAAWFIVVAHLSWLFAEIELFISLFIFIFFKLPDFFKLRTCSVADYHQSLSSCSMFMLTAVCPQITQSFVSINVLFFYLLFFQALVSVFVPGLTCSQSSSCPGNSSSSSVSVYGISLFSCHVQFISSDCSWAGKVRPDGFLFYFKLLTSLPLKLNLPLNQWHL